MAPARPLPLPLPLLPLLLLLPPCARASLAWGGGTAFCLAGDAAAGGAGPGWALRFLWQSPRWPGPALVSSVWGAGAGGRLLGCAVTRAPDEPGGSAERCRALQAGLGAPLRDDAAPGVQRSLAALEARVGECPVLSLRDAAAFVPAVRALEAAARAARERVRRGMTMPGTVWCGAGDSAGNFSDLGVFQGPDSCCREHDQCSVQITALQRKHGIFNLRPYTISHCDCDTRFRTCLMDLNDTIADFIGMTYFSVLQIPCFYLEESDEACLEWAWWGGCLPELPVPPASGRMPVQDRPHEVKCQLHNPDSLTLFHRNCTRRLARFLRRTKGPNEVEGEVLSDYVSASCFVLQPPSGCMEGDEEQPE